MSTSALRHGAVPLAGRGDPASIGLWAFIGVATSLFSLFLAAYVMRMAESDWSSFAMPWQLWLSTGFLAAGSVALHQSSVLARAGNWSRSRAWLLAGGVCAAAFLMSQLWAWQALRDLQVVFSNNPAASFFYLLTAMHGLHLLGGLAAWAVTAGGNWDPTESNRTALRITLCARYWHFMLGVWLLLFGALGWLTPEMARFICGRA